MIGPSSKFLEDLNQQHVSLLEKVQGRLRLDLSEDSEVESWMIIIDKGNIRVSRERADADCVIHTERAFFDRLVTGEANAMSALIRGLIQVEGDIRLALSIGRLVPGPPHSRWRGHRGALPARRRTG